MVRRRGLGASWALFVWGSSMDSMDRSIGTPKTGSPVVVARWTQGQETTGQMVTAYTQMIQHDARRPLGRSGPELFQSLGNANHACPTLPWNSSFTKPQGLWLNLASFSFLKREAATRTLWRLVAPRLRPRCYPSHQGDIFLSPCRTSCATCAATAAMVTSTESLPIH